MLFLLEQSYNQHIIISLNIMETSSNPKTYNYTFYGSYNSPENNTHKSYINPLTEQDKNSYRQGTFTTIHSQSHDSKDYPYSTPTTLYKQPIFQNKYQYFPKSSIYQKKEQSKPLTFTYKNPGCGIQISGKSGFESKGEYVTIKLQKILNSRNAGISGTLRLQMIRMPYFYDGGQTIKPQEYTSVCTSELGELQAGWSLKDIVRGGLKRKDDPSDNSYRKCYVLLVQEYVDGNFRIVDYMNFD